MFATGESAEAIKVVKDPSVALAAPDGHEWVGGTLVKPSEKAVAAVVKPSGDVVTFAKLADALAAADGATVQLLTDVTESVVIPADKTITLDLAGHTMSERCRQGCHYQQWGPYDCGQLRGWVAGATHS